MNVSSSPPSSAPKPLALVVLLENVGHIAGVKIPQWTMDTIDFVTEEYAKWLLKRLGAHQRYDRVVILEDEQVTGKEMTDTLIQTSQTHRVDQLLLVHGQQHSLVGYRGKAHVDGAVFKPLLRAYEQDPRLLDLRMVYGLNCYGASLAPVWIQLGACAVNGAIGVNWLPEPSLSLFLRGWLNGASYSQAVAHSHSWAIRVGKRIWQDNADGSDHPRIAGSRQIIYGRRDLTIHTS
jgi:hypothetical protein